jgi:hypothetical protein
MEPIKLTKEELEKLVELQKKSTAVVQEFGNVEIMKLQVEARKEELVAFYTQVKEDERTFGKELSEKYGDGTIDIEKGEFLPAGE